MNGQSQTGFLSLLLFTQETKTLPSDPCITLNFTGKANHTVTITGKEGREGERERESKQSKEK